MILPMWIIDLVGTPSSVFGVCGCAGVGPVVVLSPGTPSMWQSNCKWTPSIHQYAITLHRMSTEFLDTVFGRELFPLEALEDTAPVPRVLRASTQMAAMGLRRPPVGPVGPGPVTAHQGEDCPGCTRCHLRPSG